MLMIHPLLGQLHSTLMIAVMCGGQCDNGIDDLTTTRTVIQVADHCLIIRMSIV